MEGLGSCNWLGAGLPQRARKGTLALLSLPLGLFYLLPPATSCLPHFHQPAPQQN